MSLIAVTVIEPYLDREQDAWVANCDREGCDASTLPRGTKARADAEARSRGWERFINEAGDVGHYCTQCGLSIPGEGE